MICPKCKNETQDGSAFCAYCGTAMEVSTPQQEQPSDVIANDTVSVEETGMQGNIAVSEDAQNNLQQADASGCQTESQINPQIQMSAADENEENNKAEKKCRKGKKGFVFAAIAIVLVVALAASYLLWFKKPKSDTASSAVDANERILYVSGGVLYYRDASFDEAICLSDEYFDKDTLIYYDVSQIYITKDRKNIYYRGDFYQNSSTYNVESNLYRRSLTNPEEEPVLIQSNVSDYTMFEDYGYILYNKNDSLYEHELKTDNVYFIADYTYLYETVVCEKSKNKYYYIEHSFDAPYESGKLYAKVLGGEKKAIDDNVKRCCIPEKSDIVYYEKDAEEKISYDTFVEFDESIDYHNRELVENLENIYFSSWLSSLYKYDGKESEFVAEYASCYYGEDGFYYSVYDFDSCNAKINLSDIDKEYDVEEFIFDNVPVTAYLMIDGKFRKLEMASGMNVADFCDYDKSIILYTYDDGVSSYVEGTYDIYKTKFDGKGFSEPELIDSNIYSFQYENDKLVVYKDVDIDAYLFDVYINGELIVEDVNNFKYSKNGNYYYMTGSTGFDGYYHSQTYINVDGEETYLGEDIMSKVLFDNGQAFYSLYNGTEYEYYLWDNGESEFLGTNSEHTTIFFDAPISETQAVYYVVDGTLYAYDGETTEKIADDISGVISDYYSEMY